MAHQIARSQRDKHDIISCLTEMERLQAKVMELHEQTKINKIQGNEKTKKTGDARDAGDAGDAGDAERNMAVIERWLNTHQYNEEQKVLSRVAEQNYNDYIENNVGRVTFSTEEEEEERNIVMDNYRKSCIMKFNSHTSWIEPPKKRMDAFNTGGIPSKFMIDYIEATHNLFQIQKKRIDDLETVVAELKEKLE
tara:strand:+ start:710 stop:1291 length:582 start_codon:yes stop_codon:yes gene_type:complete